MGKAILFATDRSNYGNICTVDTGANDAFKLSGECYVDMRGNILSSSVEDILSLGVGDTIIAYVRFNKTSFSLRGDCKIVKVSDNCDRLIYVEMESDDGYYADAYAMYFYKTSQTQWSCVIEGIDADYIDYIEERKISNTILASCQNKMLIFPLDGFSSGVCISDVIDLEAYRPHSRDDYEFVTISEKYKDWYFQLTDNLINLCGYAYNCKLSGWESVDRGGKLWLGTIKKNIKLSNPNETGDTGMIVDWQYYYIIDKDGSVEQVEEAELYEKIPKELFGFE